MQWFSTTSVFICTSHLIFSVENGYEYERSTDLFVVQNCEKYISNVRLACPQNRDWNPLSVSFRCDILLFTHMHCIINCARASKSWKKVRKVESLKIQKVAETLDVKVQRRKKNPRFSRNILTNNAKLYNNNDLEFR